MQPEEVTLGIAALNDRSREARPSIMRWAVATVAVQDLLKEAFGKPPSWPKVAEIATRWLEEYGKSTGRWESTEQAALELSVMSQRSPRLLKPPRPGVLGLFDRFDKAVSLTMQRYGILFLRWSLGIVFVWFGALKPFGLSPADNLVTGTVTWFPAEYFIPILGVWEVAIGLCLLFRPLLRVALFLLFLQMPGTALPLLLMPEVCFTHFPFGLTLEGQYIIKNLTLISAAIVVGGTVRHGRTREDQERVTWML